MRSFQSLAALGVLLAGIAVPPPPSAAEVPSPYASRRYSVQGHGVLELRVPIGWRDSVEAPQGSMPTILTLRAPSGEELLISIFPNARRDPDFVAASRIKPRVEQDGRSLLPTAVESELVLHELKGTSHTGYFYSFTDKALVGKEPAPGEFKYLTQGQVGAGEFLLLFTILTNEKASPSRDEALRIVTTAVQGNPT